VLTTLTVIPYSLTSTRALSTGPARSHGGAGRRRIDATSFLGKTRVVGGRPIGTQGSASAVSSIQSGAAGDSDALHDIANAEPDQVAPAQLAVDGEIEQCRQLLAMYPRNWKWLQARRSERD
jgi:hypothetical protein